MYGSHRWTGWGAKVPVERWFIYQRFLEGAIATGVPFALAGGLATATHTGRWRDTNDLDVYTLPQRRQTLIDMIERLGLEDVQPRFPYDPSWTYRASEGQTIVEVIWSMANHHASVDDLWIARAEEMDIRGIRLRVTAPEEMMWVKLYVLKRERCDWPDVLNYLYFCGEGLDWEHLLNRLGEDAHLLSSIVALLCWLSPERAAKFPLWIWDRLGLLPPAHAGATGERMRGRAHLLSTNDWFGPLPEGPVGSS